MPTSPFRLALVLGLISAIGPFAIDMYLPALPAIGRALGTDVAGAQASLASFFLAFAVSQAVYGPASDLLGRRPPLVFGLALFALASVGCALAPDIGTLVAFRFLQGLGAGAGMVIPRAVVRDLHTGAEAARLMSLLMLVFSVCPLLAPLVGSLVIDAAGWRAIFWTIGALAAAGLVLQATALAETRPRSARAGSSVGRSLTDFGVLLRDRHFIGLALISTFAMGSFFVYLGNSSFVMIEHYGLTPRQYSLAFGFNALAFFGMAQANGRLARRLGLPRLVTTGVVGFVATSATLAALFAAGIDSLALMITLLFAGNAFLALVVPTSSVLALEQHGERAGTASALLGTMQLTGGALIMGVGGAHFDVTPLPMVLAIAACGVLAACATWWTLRGLAPAPEVPARPGQPRPLAD